MVTLFLAATAAPFLHRPFEGDHRSSGFFDHGHPARGNDHRQLTTWGSWTWGRRGHGGYDWPMKIGTPVFAAADGVVMLAGEQGPSRCGGKTVEHDVRVGIRHERDVPLLTWYLHLSAAKVEVGQQVKAGDRIGLSGNSGCSSGPHLHFGVQEATPRRTMVDPYGWSGSTPDPTAGRRRSEWLWLPEQAPLLYRIRRAAPARLAVALGRVKMVAWGDEDPNQEWLEIVATERVQLGGWTLRNRVGTVVTLPEQARARPGHAYRVFSGKGRSNRRFGFAGRDRDLWSNTGDCVELRDSSGTVVERVALGRTADQLCREREGWRHPPTGGLRSGAATAPSALPLHRRPRLPSLGDESGQVSP